MNSNLFVYTCPGDDNIIYHTITDPDTGKSCYPDILIQHNFAEKEIMDSQLYQIADDAIRHYGSSRCYFISYKDEGLLNELLERIDSIYSTEDTPNSHYEDAVRDFAQSLMLSATMTNSLRTLLIYYGDFVGDLENFISNCSKEYSLPVANKNEGKKIYELIRQKILC